jgi:pimeloyl-ACP methyl ester carboxylesterase
MQTLEFHSGGQLIWGRLHVPASLPAPGILMIPGFADTAGGIHNMHVQTARELCRSGFAVLRFDYRGLGESDGDFRDFTVHSGLTDARAALDALRGHPDVDSAKIGMCGFSLGGALAAELTALDGKVHALSLWAPVAHMERVFNGFFKEEHQLEVLSRGWMDWMGWRVGGAFLSTVGGINPTAALLSSAIPTLVIQGTNDSEVPPYNAETYAEAGAIVEWLDRGDHLFSSVALKEEAIRLTCQWFAAQLL